jgi:serine/threonine protein kinase
MCSVKGMESFKNLNGLKGKKIFGSGSKGRVYDFEESKGNFYAVKVSDVKEESAKTVAFGELDVLLKLKDVGATPEMKPIPQVHGCELDNNNFSILMTKFYRNFNYGEVNDRVAEFNFRKILMLIKGAAETLKSIHDTEILHGDLHPGSMMFINEDLTQVGYIDFSLSRKKDSKLKIGNPYFTSPEIRFLEEFDAEKSELWSFGTSIGAMLFGYDIISQNGYSSIFLISPENEKGSSKVSESIDKMILNFKVQAEKKREKWTSDCGELSFKAFSDAFLGIFKLEKERISLADFIKGMKDALKHGEKLCPQEKAQSSSYSCIPGCEIFII